MGAQQGKPQGLPPGFEVGQPKPVSRIKGLKPRQPPRSPVISSQGPISIMGPTASTLNYFTEHSGKRRFFINF